MNITNVLTASQRVRIVAIEKTPKSITVLSAVSSEVRAAREFALALRRLMKQRLSAQFPQGLAQAEQSTVPEVRSFAVGLRHEYAAVAAALEYPWSKGPARGTPID